MNYAHVRTDIPSRRGANAPLPPSTKRRPSTMDYTKHYQQYIQARNQRLRQRERIEMAIGLALIALFTAIALTPFLILLAQGAAP